LTKSVLASLIGLLSVTDPGTYETWIFSDPLHSYYLEVLWQERFKLEVDSGRILPREPDHNVRLLLKDSLCCCVSLCCTCCCRPSRS